MPDMLDMSKEIVALHVNLDNANDDWMREKRRRIEAVKAVRKLLDLAEGNLQTVFDHTSDTKETFGHLPNSPSVKSARAIERAWCDAIAAGKAVLESPEKRERT